MDTRANSCLGGIILLALVACSTNSKQYGSTADTDTYGMDGSSGQRSSTTTGTGTGTGTGSTGSSTGDTGNAAMTQSSSNPATSSASGGTTAGSMAQASYGVVQAIDQMTRQDVGAGTVGAAAAGGSVSGAPTDKVYRITVRMDDGSNQIVVLDSMPAYQVGDRVRYSNGMLQAY